jgi:hypothetical protein
MSAPARWAARQARAKPILDAMKPWLEAKLAAVSGKSTIAEAIRHALSRWEGLTRYLDDGRIEIDDNVVERGMRTVATGPPLCTSFSSIWKHWKCVRGLVATRATPSGDRRADGIGIQIA